MRDGSGVSEPFHNPPHSGQIGQSPVGVKSAGSGLIRRPSGLPSIADILPRCREPLIGAMSRALPSGSFAKTVLIRFDARRRRTAIVSRRAVERADSFEGLLGQDRGQLPAGKLATKRGSLPSIHPGEVGGALGFGLGGQGCEGRGSQRE